MADTVGRMVRKQLNLEATQDEALKRLAGERGVSESEVVREALQRLIDSERADKEQGRRAVAILDELFAEWDLHPIAPLTPEERAAYRFGIYDGL